MKWSSYWAKERRLALHKRATIDIVMKVMSLHFKTFFSNYFEAFRHQARGIIICFVRGSLPKLESVQERFNETSNASFQIQGVYLSRISRIPSRWELYGNRPKKSSSSLRNENRRLCWIVADSFLFLVYILHNILSAQQESSFWFHTNTKQSFSG